MVILKEKNVTKATKKAVKERGKRGGENTKKEKTSYQLKRKMRKSNWGCLRIVKDGLVSQVSK